MRSETNCAIGLLRSQQQEINVSDDELKALRAKCRASPEAEHTLWYVLFARAVEAQARKQVLLNAANDVVSLLDQVGLEDSARAALMGVAMRLLRQASETRVMKKATHD